MLSFPNPSRGFVNDLIYIVYFVLYSNDEVMMALSRIDGLLSENNTESYLYNLMWNVFPHVTPINCPVASATTGGDKSQLGNLLQKVMDGLDIYSKVS